MAQTLVNLVRQHDPEESGIDAYVLEGLHDPASAEDILRTAVADFLEHGPELEVRSFVEDFEGRLDWGAVVNGLPEQALNAHGIASCRWSEPLTIDRTVSVFVLNDELLLTADAAARFAADA